MSFTIKLADAAFDTYLARAIPYLSDAQALFIFGGDATQSAANKITGGSGSWVGGGSAGAFGDYHAMLNITYSLDSGINSTGINQTIISVSEYQENEHSAFATSGSSLQVSRITGAAYARYRGSNVGIAGNQIPLDTPIFQGATMGGAAGTFTRFNAASGSLITDTGTSNTFSSQAIQFGPKDGEDDNDGTGDTTFHKHYLAMIYDREMSEAEILEVYAWAAEYLAARGVGLS